MARFILFTEKYDPSSEESWKEAEGIAQRHLEAARMAIKEHEERGISASWGVEEGEAGHCEIGVFLQPRDVTLGSEAMRAFVAGAVTICHTYWAIIRETCDAIVG